MARRRKDLATVSFHYIQRERHSNGKIEERGFSPEEFDELCAGVRDQPWPDLDDEATFERVRNGVLVPFREFERLNSRTARGFFQVSYTGHAFHNSRKGKIEADTVNQREFQYLLYHAVDGRVFIGAQYLGNYGGYETLRYGLLKHLASRAGVRSYSFRRDIYDAAAVHAKEIRVNVARGADRLDEDNSLTRRTLIVLQRGSKEDSRFEEAARANFLPIATSDENDRKARVARALSDTGLMSVEDEEVTDCVVIADVNGKEKRVYLLGDSNVATRFSLHVPYNLDGHPEPDPTKAEMLKALNDQIISQL